MPIYEYKCENSHVFDIMQRMSEDSLTTCIECDAPVRKIMHPVGISFKGSGFYSTDYSGKSKADPATKTDSPAKTDSSNSNGDSKNGSDNSSKEPKTSDSSSKSDSSSSASSSSSKKD